MSDSDKRSDSGALSITGTTQRSRVWSITINNPTEEDKQTWSSATTHHFVKEAKGQLEKGENGTLHIQGYLRTDPVRFSQVKKLFPRAHIEVARNAPALSRYCEKEETRVAPINQTKIATPHKIQSSLSNYVFELLTVKGNPLRFYKDFENKKIVWKNKQIEWEEVNPPTGLLDWSDSDSDRQIALIKLNKEYIQTHADEIIDTVVEQLIESGIFTVEFIMSNNQVRTAYKRYLSSIIIRNVRQEGSEEGSEAINEGESSPGTEVD